MSRMRKSGYNRSSCSTAGNGSQSCHRRPSGTSSGAGGQLLRIAVSSCLRKAVQNGIGALINRFCSQFRGRNKVSSFVVFPRRDWRSWRAGISSGWKAGTGMRNGLRGTCLIFTPQWSTQSLWKAHKLVQSPLFFLRVGILVEPHYAVKREGVVEKTSIHWHTVAYANTDRADGRVETILPE